MILFLVCVLCNVLLAIIFKSFEKYGIDNLNAIIINYFTCIIVASIATGGFIIPLNLIDQPWFYYSLLMGIFFIFGFNLMGYSFQKAGVALTVIIAKMSLILPVIFAITLYNESLRVTKLMGILAAIAAIIFVNIPSNKVELQKLKISAFIILLPVLVWLLSGFIEITLFYVQIEELVTDDSLTFVVTSFGIAGILGLTFTSFRMLKSQIYPTTKDLIGGLVLGLPNFLTIYLLLYLLKEGWEGSVLFPLNNIAILLLTALVGFIFYKERINTMKGVGLFLSLVAIVLIGMNS